MITLLLVAAVVLLWALPAGAQVPADIFPTLQAGTYNLRVQAPSEVDVVALCLEQIELAPAVEIACKPATPNEIVEFTVTVQAQGIDVEIRAYAYDTSGNKSEQSPNAARIDLTPPSAPSFVP